MKGLFYVLFTLLSSTLFGASVSVTNEILTIDQNNNPSVPGVLGTVSDLARLEAQTEINAAAATVASQVYSQATNLLDSVAAEISSERTVVYRTYFLDSFTAVVIIDPAVDKVAIYGWDKLPNAQQDQPGRQKWYMYFGCTADIHTLTPKLKTASSLSQGTSGFQPLDAQYVTGFTPMSGTWTDRDGNTFSYLYRLTVSIPTEQSHFCIVYVDGDGAGSSGDTMTVIGGFSGGVTQTVTSGNLTLTFTGGLCTGVVDSNAP